MPIRLLVSEPLAAAAQTGPVRVSFVLEPTWLPDGFTPTAGAGLTPPPGLRVYPHTGVGVSSVGVSKGTDAGRPVSLYPEPIFMLTYYALHHPESKSIRLVAMGSAASATLPDDATSIHKLDGRMVRMTSYPEDITISSWHERGVLVTVATQGVTMSQTARFISALAERKPPRG